MVSINATEWTVVVNQKGDADVSASPQGMKSFDEPREQAGGVRAIPKALLLV